MIKNSMILFAFVLLTVTSCKDINDIEADEQALIKMNEQWDKNVMTDNQKNADYYTDDAISVDNGKIYKGKEAIANLFKSYDEDYTILSGKNRIENISISGNLATVRGSYSGSLISLESGDTLQIKGAWVDLCERQVEGVWKIVYSIGTELKD